MAFAFRISLIITLSLSLSSCFGPRRVIPVDQASAAAPADYERVMQALLRQQEQIGAATLLLKVSAQKSAFVQNATMAVVYGGDKRLRVTVFASQFNRLLSLLVMQADSLSLLLPESDVLLFGDANAESMELIFGLPMEVDEFVQWMLGVTPARARKNTLLWDEHSERFIYEYHSPQGSTLLGRLKELSRERFRLEALEVIRDGASVLSAEIVWGSDEYPQSHRVSLHESGVELTVTPGRVNVYPDGLPEENPALFAEPKAPGVPRVELKALAKNAPILFSR